MRVLLSGSLVFFSLVAAACSHPAPEKADGGSVVVYVSEDQVFSQPVLERFEKESGIRVRAVYDTEEAKSTGVMNRLLAEKDNPQADVYWANEPIRAEVLRQRGVAEAYHSPSAEGIPAVFRDPDGFWTGFSARIRVLILNSSAEGDARSVFDLASPEYRGRAILANPLFGTTTSHIAAIFVALGEERGRAFLDDLKKNDISLSTSNGESADEVAAGRADLSLVDSDDAVNRLRRGDALRMVVPDQDSGQPGCFVVPNAVVLVHGARHPQAARRLMDFLLSKEAEVMLAAADCAQIPLHPGLAAPADLPALKDIRVMEVSYADVAREMLKIQPELKAWAGY